jgi:hypothetical protein
VYVHVLRWNGALLALFDLPRTVKSTHVLGATAAAVEKHLEAGAIVQIFAGMKKLMARARRNSKCPFRSRKSTNAAWSCNYPSSETQRVGRSSVDLVGKVEAVVEEDLNDGVAIEAAIELLANKIAIEFQDNLPFSGFSENAEHPFADLEKLQAYTHETFVKEQKSEGKLHVEDDAISNKEDRAQRECEQMASHRSGFCKEVCYPSLILGMVLVYCDSV